MSTEQPTKDGKYYTDTEIAGLQGISLGRLRNKLCTGSPLPPHIQPPGCRNRLLHRNHLGSLEGRPNLSNTAGVTSNRMVR